MILETTELYLFNYFHRPMRGVIILLVGVLYEVMMLHYFLRKIEKVN